MSTFRCIHHTEARSWRLFLPSCLLDAVLPSTGKLGPKNILGSEYSWQRIGSFSYWGEAVMINGRERDGIKAGVPQPQG